MKVNLETDKVSRLFIKYLIPSILVMIAQNIAMVVDSYFVGNYIGANGLSAITLFFPLVSFFIGVAMMVAVGSNNLSGIYLGKGEPGEANRIFNIALRIIVIFSVSLTVIAIFNMENLTKLLDVSGEIKRYTIDYGQGISLFFVFFMVNSVLALYLKLEGKPHLIIISTTIGTLANVVLDYLLIVVFKAGLTGAALATGISQIVTFSILLVYFIRGSKWHLERVRLHFIDLKRICSNGMYQFLNSSTNAISGFVLNFIILRMYGEIGIAGYAITLQIVSIVLSIGNGIGEASRAGISHNYGAQGIDRVKGLRNITFFTNLIVGAVLAIAAFVWGDAMASIFTKEVQVIEMTSYILKFYGICFVVLGVNLSTGTYFSAINDSRDSSLFTIYRCLLSILIGLLVFPAIFGRDGIWIAILFKEMSAFVIALFLFGRRSTRMVMANF